MKYTLERYVHLGKNNKLKKKNLPLLCCVGLVNFWLVLSRDQLTWLPREDSSSEVAPYQLFLQPQAILLPYANISNGLKHNVGQKSWTKRNYIFASCQPSWCSCPAGWPYDIFSGPGALYRVFKIPFHHPLWIKRNSTIGIRKAVETDPTRSTSLPVFLAAPVFFSSSLSSPSLSVSWSEFLENYILRTPLGNNFLHMTKW